MAERIHATVIVGAGPGGTGPLVWAAQRGRLAELLDRGVLLIDRHATPGARALGRYVLNADSLGTSFLECVDATDTRSALGLDALPPETLALERHRERHPPLALVSRHLTRIGEALGRTLTTHRRSTFLPRTTVRRIVLERRDRVAVETLSAGGTRRIHHARSAVVALGGRQRLADLLTAAGATARALRDVPGQRLALTDRLLTADGLAAVGARLCDVRDPRVTILGGSHSAFSSAWALVHRVPEIAWRPGSIRILYRSAPRVFYPTLADARADGYAAKPDDVCPRTQRVHRLGGLRGDGRALWRSMTGRPGAAREDRVSLTPIAEADDLHDLLAASELVVPAFGYRATTVPMVDSDGRPVRLAAEDGGALVDDECRVRRAGGGTLDRVFGIGMASGFLPSGSLGGERSFAGQTNGVWLYQNGIGARIVAGLDALEDAAA